MRTQRDHRQTLTGYSAGRLDQDGPTTACGGGGSAHTTDAVGTIFAGLFGLLLSIGLLKLGNPVILDRLIEMPRGIDQWRAFAWPVRIAHVGLLVTCLMAIPLARRSFPPRASGWLLGAMALWLGWQFVAARGSAAPAATRDVLVHFVACVACFLLGHLALSRVREPRVFWLCLVLGFVGVLGMAFEQRFGGLDETRRMILRGEGAANLPPEYLARIQSNRVFGTLVYPNALAGAVILLLPLASILAWRLGERWGTNGSRVTGGAMLAAGLAVLTWSGSKAGWLLAMAVGLFLLFHAPLRSRLKLALAGAFLVLGLAGFGWAFAEKLSRGATSVAARFDYWSAAWDGFRQHPLVGNGPGAFKVVYARLKRPESEMAQLAHNDFLQQATDSGLPGFAGYVGFVCGGLLTLYRYRRHGTAFDRAVFLGVAAWFAHGVVEFGLYIPATSWCAFALLGWLLSKLPDPHEQPDADQKRLSRPPTGP